MMRSAIKKVLVVAAHPDDEVLGCGGALARMAAEGADIRPAFVADGVAGRGPGADDLAEALQTRREAASKACARLGLGEPWFHELADNRLDTVARLDITKLVEKLLDDFRPDTVLTHHGGDVNVDHRRVHEAVVTACRPQPGHPVARLWFFEVASSTEWQPPGCGAPFHAQMFVDISETLHCKLDALREYGDEIRPWPHPRSLEAVAHLARWRGATAGVEAAEAFMIGRERC